MPLCFTHQQRKEAKNDVSIHDRDYMLALLKASESQTTSYGGYNIRMEIPKCRECLMSEWELFIPPTVAN